MGVNPLCPDCGKTRYRSIQHAREANRRNGRSLRVYPCGAYFHVTSQRKKQSQ